MIMRLHVDAWDPSYGAGLDAGEDGPSESSTAELDVGVEMPADEWRPIGPPAGVIAPSVMHLVDGVRRIDARVWIDADGQSYPGLAASYAAGAVRCDLGAGVAELSAARIERGLFSPAPDLEAIGSHAARYEARPVGRGDFIQLVNGVQQRLLAMESEVSRQVNREQDLLVVDGPLRKRADLPNVIGYIKTHRSQYLPESLSKVVGMLGPGQRSPIFRLGTVWDVFTWYLRLPGPAGPAWAGVVRVECAKDLTVAEAIDLANVSSIALPRFASCAYKDPRAPQNLIPIAGLERRLRSLLGDARLLHRSLLKASAAQ
jgi:hypothetical protein